MSLVVSQDLNDRTSSCDGVNEQILSAIKTIRRLQPTQISTSRDIENGKSLFCMMQEKMRGAISHVNMRRRQSIWLKCLRHCNDHEIYLSTKSQIDIPSFAFFLEKLQTMNTVDLWMQPLIMNIIR